MNNSPLNNCTCVNPLPRKVISIAVWRVLVVLFAVSISVLLSVDMISNSHGLIIYTLLLMGYQLTEMKNLYRQDPQLFWLNPIVIASLITFLLPFGITNLLYFMPGNLLELVDLEPVATSWMNKLMLLVVLGACAMWIGYVSGVGRRLGLMLRQSLLLRRWISPSIHLNKHAVYACLLVSLIARLWSIRLGLYGFSSTYENLIAGANFSEFLTLADWLGKLILLVVAIQYFALSNCPLSGRVLFWLVLGYQVIFGFLSGMKSGVVVPFIIIAFACYSQKSRFPRWLVPVVLIAVLAAYMVIEPFRQARYESNTFTGKSLENIVSTMTDIKNIQKFEAYKATPVWLSVFARINMTSIASLGIEYAAENELPDNSPQFLSNILLAPAHALVPRFLWNEKPLQEDGFWYTQKVVGYDVYSASAMSPFTYLNFAGGPLAVLVGFLFVGIIQRSFFDALRSFGTGGLIVLLGLLSTIAIIDSSFNTVLIGLFRYFPLLIFMQYLLLLHNRRSCGSGSN